MKVPCSSCGRPFRKEEGYTRCAGCRERAKVYGHQLHRRRGVDGFRRHRCPLCAKHRRHVRLLRSSWNRRKIYIWKRCQKGHPWFVMDATKICPTCAWMIGQAYLRSLKRKRG